MRRRILRRETLAPRDPCAATHFGKYRSPAFWSCMLTVESYTGYDYNQEEVKAVSEILRRARRELLKDNG